MKTSAKIEQKACPHLDPYDEMMNTSPKHVAIIAMGPTKAEFTSMLQNITLFKSFPEEVWATNMSATWSKHDKVFMMDGPVFDEFADQRGMQEWSELVCKTSRVPVVVPYADKTEYPATCSYPIHEVVAKFGKHARFINTIGYAFAYAGLIGVERCDVFGCDFDYRDEKGEHQVGESGQPETEQIAMLCQDMGMQINVTPGSRFLKGLIDRDPTRLYYGYGRRQPVFK